MHEFMALILPALLIGVGATLVLDLWTLFLARVLNIPGPNWAMVGRWIGHFPRGKFVHQSIARADAVPGERALGWLAHYLIGVVFAALLLLICGLEWARQPTLAPALIIGVLTVAAPFLLMQPGMGAGIAASKMPKPNVARLRSLIAHSVFGLGLYGAGMFWAWVLGQTA
ncbi:DUF2938 domain-containing protein [Pseudomonas protegens]|uniref:DUF2938 domain-containing protein n=1 Tax=Pseudomonas protegens TaxID=380021 RepID=UPI0021C943E6|nr:DUF2938 domain-containing protein [Pseudomonas protegens]MCU1764583.1 DUF2938 domain-containing protein [Pseudomonas protegens]